MAKRTKHSPALRPRKSAPADGESAGGAAKSVIITVADGALPDINGLAHRLEQSGLRVGRVLPVTGVIAGSCKDADISELRKTEGVLSVEEELVARLPPADSKLQ